MQWSIPTKWTLFQVKNCSKTHWKMYQIQMQLSESSTQKSSQFHLKCQIWTIVFPVLIFIEWFSFPLFYIIFRQYYDLFVIYYYFGQHCTLKTMALTNNRRWWHIRNECTHVYQLRTTALACVLHSPAFFKCE